MNRQPPPVSDLARAFIDGTGTLTGPAPGRSGQRLPGASQVRN
jgi:hypothetical protein